MSNNKLEGRNRIAIFHDGVQISNYKYEYSKIVNGYIIAYNTCNLFDIYNPDGKLIFESGLTFLAGFSGSGNDNVNNHFVVSNNKGHTAVFRYDGQCIIPFLFDEIYLFFNVIVVKNSNVHGAYNYDGKLLIPVRYECIDCLDSHGIIVTRNNKQGMYSYSGEMLIPVNYSKIYFSSTGEPICQS